MPTGKPKMPGLNAGEASEELENHEELATKLPLAEAKANGLTLTKEKPPPLEEMSNPEIILRELREFRSENSVSLKAIQDEIKKTNNRVEEAEQRIMESEDRLQTIEGATLELMELQKQFANRLTNQESRARRDNIRIHGVKEEAANGVSMIS